MERPASKTRRKQEMAALQDIGEELVELTGERLDALDLPEILRDAVVEARRISGHEARRRQLQYIGKLMRGVDPEPIRARLAEWKAPERAQVAQFKLAEAWRDRLLHDPAALADFLQRHPSADSASLRGLIEATGRERAENRAPRSYRRLFQFLRTILDARG